MSTIFKKIHLVPENKTFSDIMSNNKSYTVPPFQRDYAWGEEQIEELWQDFEGAIEEKTQHFMGYLVLKSTEAGFFEIIDGQQRLTTITLMIIAALFQLKKLVENNDSTKENQERIDYYHKAYLAVFDASTLETSRKLTLNDNNKKHFIDIIARGYTVPKLRILTASNRKLNRALEFFQRKLAAYDGEQLANFVKNIEKGFLFTTITVEDDLDAFTIFETLNARGIFLSAPDLLKNYLFSLVASEYGVTPSFLDELNDDWLAIINELGATNFTLFLRAYHSMTDKLILQKNLYRMLKQKINKAEQVIPYVKSIKEYASIYAALRNPKDDLWTEYESGIYTQCVDDLHILKIYNIKIPLSLLMAAHKKFAASKFIKILSWVGVVSIRYNVIGGREVKNLERKYNEIANDIMSKKGDSNALNDVKNALMSICPSDENFKSDFAKKTMLGRPKPQRVTFLLRKIETHCCAQEPPANATLEHILPHIPNDAWQEYFGLEDYNSAIDRLGNMTLLPPGVELGQETFAEKKAILQKTGFAINKELCNYDAWDIENLNQHQQWLAKQASAVWRIK